MPFTPEELAAMAAADAEIEASFALTPEDIAFGRELDREIALEMMTPRKLRIAQQHRAYYEAHREEINTYQREYRKRKRARQSSSSEQAQQK